MRREQSWELPESIEATIDGDAITFRHRTHHGITKRMCLPDCTIVGRHIEGPADALTLEVKVAIEKAARAVADAGTHRDACTRKIEHDLGKYRHCSVENYQVYHPDQKLMLERFRKYRDKVAEHVERGHGLLLLGSVGAGKDHLLADILMEAGRTGKSAEFINGPELIREVDRNERWNPYTGEDELGRHIFHCDVLGISDAVGQNSLMPSQRQHLFHVVDARYRQGRATWATLNVADDTEAQELLTPPVYDRLRHNALQLAFDWPSFRTRARG